MPYRISIQCSYILVYNVDKDLLLYDNECMALQRTMLSLLYTCNGHSVVCIEPTEMEHNYREGNSPCAR